MKIQLHLLFIIVAISVASTEPTKAKFPAKLLQPDLQEISKYYEKGGEIPEAFIHMYDSITFRVQLITDESGEYLGIEGHFQFKSKGVQSYNELYFIDDEFFVRGNHGLFENIPPKDIVAYSPPSITMTEPYLLIEYCEIEGIRQTTDDFYMKYGYYIDTVMDVYPGTFLAAHPSGPFVEYTFLSTNLVHSTPNEVQVIIGRILGDTVSLLANIRGSKLVFDQKQHAFTAFDSVGAPIFKALSVRTVNEAFLAEVGKYDVNMLSLYDLYMAETLPSIHQVSEDELLHKAKTVEPRISEVSKEFPPAAWVTRVRFQVHGIVFIKILNYKDDRINEACPFIIETEDKMRKIWFEGSWVDKVCTDDQKLSVYKT